MKFKSDIEAQAAIRDASNSPGTANQILSSTVSGTAWIDPGAIGGGYLPLSAGSGFPLTGDLYGTNAFFTGNVGINTTTPTNGKLVIDSTANQIAIETGTAGDGRLNIGHFSNGTFIGTYGDDAGAADVIRFGTHSGDERMRIASGGNVGIGITNPGAKLTVDGAGYSFIAGYDSGNRRVHIGLDSAGEPSIQGTLSNGTARQISINPSGGNVGIGTTNPGAKLQVKTATDQNIAFNLISGGPLNGIQRITSYNDAITASVPLGIGALELYFLSGASSAESMRITSNGNVLVNKTSSTGDIFQVQGNDNVFAARLDGSTTVGQSYGLRLRAGTNALDKAFLIENTSGTDLVSVNGDGNVGIGTSSPIAKLSVLSASTGYSSDSQIKISDGSTSYYGGLSFDDAGSTRLSVRNSYDGTGSIVGFGFGGSSDKVQIINGTGLIVNEGNVGIGTTNPTRKLHVSSGSTVPAVFDSTQDYTLGLARDGIEEWWLKTYTDGRFAIHENGVGDNVTIKAGGNVGIGTTSPADKLEVQDGNIRIEQVGNTDAKLIFNPYSSALGTTYQWELAGGNAANNYNFQIRENGTNYLTVDSSVNGNAGYVGIGTTAPGAKLEVNVASGDGILIKSADIATLKFKGGGSNNWGFATTNLASGDFGIYKSNVQGGDPISAGTPQLYIKSNGDVGIGTTSPSEKLHVSGNLRVTGAFVDSSASVGSAGTVLSSTNTGTAWVGASGLPGGPYLPLAGGTMTGDIILGDGIKASFGTGSDLNIYHNGTNGIIQNLTGGLYLLGSGSEQLASFISNGAASLFYDNVAKLETTSTGVAVAGSIDLLSDGGVLLNGGLALFPYLNDTYIRPYAASGDIKFQNYSGNILLTLSTAGPATFTGTVTAPTFSGDLNGTINTVTTAVTKANATNDTTVATTAFVQNLIGTIPAGLVFQGTWDAATNTPTLTSGTGTTGNFYIVSTSGSTDLDGVTDWVTGDWAVFIEQGATDAWEKIDNSSVLNGTGTGQTVALWSGSGTSNTLTDAPITISGSDTTFAGDITLVDDLNFATNGFADISNTGTGAMRFKPSSETLALTLVGADATFAGDVTATANYTASASKIIYKAQRLGGAVAGDWSYDDATTDMSLGTSTAHSFSLKTGNTRALTLDTSQNATFAGSLTTSDDITIDNSSPELYFKTGATHYSWMVAAQENVNQNFEITPSTAVGGTTFSTPALKINGSDSAATFAGTVNAPQASLSTSSTTDAVLRLIDTGVIAYDWSFPDTATLKLSVSATSNKTLLLQNSGTGEFNLSVDNNATFGGDVTVTGTSSTFNTGNSGTFVTNDGEGYPRLTMSSSTAQLGLFRSSTSVGGMYIGADANGFRIMDASFGTKFTLSQSGAGVFSDTVTSPTFLGDLNGTINTATTGATQTAGDNSTKIATTAYADAAAAAVPIGNYLPLTGGTLTGNLSIQADSAFFFVKSADYTLSRIIPRGVGADLDKGLFSLYSVGTENVRVDSAGDSWFNGGDVGIGNAVPDSKIQVEAKNASNVIYAGLRVGYNSTSNNYYDADAHHFRNGLGTSAKLTLDSFGNSLFSGPTYIMSGQKLFLNNSVNTASGSIVCPGGGSLALQSYGNNMIYLNENAEIRFSTSSSQQMVIDSTGNVGIGTTNPSGRLQLTAPDVGSVRSYTTASGFGLIFDQYYSAASEPGASYTRTADIVASTGDVSSSQIRFLTKPASANPAVAMLISGNSNVGIGTIAPVSKLQVDGGIQMADDTDAAAAAKAGTMRYRTGTEYVEVDGVEIVTNGDFATDSDWNKGTGWTISGGKANAVAATSDFTQTVSFTLGQTYRLTYTISNYSAGALRTSLGAYAVNTPISANGNYTDIFTPTNVSSNSLLYFEGRDGFTGSIDNVSLIEVTAEDASYADMCMQTGASTYEWVNIVRNTY